MDYKKINSIRKQLQERHPGFPVPEKSYLILYSARSGSNLLCNYLTKVGIGNPVEAFNANRNYRNHLGWDIDFGDPVEYMKTLIYKQSVDGIMGMKLSILQFNLLLETAASLFDATELNDSEVVETLFPNVKYIQIHRKDKIKQAISFSKAVQNGIWFEEVGADTSYKDYVIPAVYDRNHIERCFDRQLMQDVAWKHYLSKNKLPYLHVWFEDLINEPQKTIQDIYDFLGIKGKQVASASLRKQSDSRSEKWEMRFKNETPWLKDKNIVQALENCDFMSLYIARSVAISNQREEKRYWQMPSTRFRWFRKWFIRGKRKLQRMLSISK